MTEEIDINDICKEIQENALKVTKCSNSVNNLDFNYFNNFEKFNQIMKHQNKHSLLMISSLIENENKGKKIEKQVEDEDKFDMICEINDNMFDRIGNYCDEELGLKKKEAELVLATINSNKNIDLNNLNIGSTSSWNRNIIKAKRVGNYRLLSAKMVERSQLKFKDKISNSNKPFVPIIKDKPNSIRPLSILPEINEEGFETYSHPYETEIDKFEPKDYFLQIQIPKMPKPVTETNFKFISTEPDLVQMCEQLKSCKEIAVDLEHHSYRTFQGFTCLMQISTSDYDYIIDTLELRSEMNLINEIFTSPSILKVFHGADMDIVWLQRDFGVYVVNLFDTSQAARLLNFPHLSLSYLLKNYCNIEADKKFQLADWRIRPLNEDMIKYAREDTHYLLFIYNQMKNELISKGNIDKNLLKAVFERSKNVCLKKYEKPLYHSESYQFLLKKSKVSFNSKQIFALKELFAWRDRIARNEDESIGYVLPNHMLMHIAEVLPREQQGILACCNPIPPLVKQQLNEIHLIILKARNMPSVKTSEPETIDPNISNLSNKMIDLDESFETRDDTFHLDRDHNSETLINEFSDNKTNQLQNKIQLIKNLGPIIKIFSDKKYLHKNKLVEKISSSFISQYEKFKSAIERKKKLRKENEESLENNISNNDKSLNRVYSHYLKLTSGSESKTQKNSNPCEQFIDEEEIKESNSSHHSNESRKKKRNMADIECNSVASMKHRIEEQQIHTNIKTTSNTPSNKIEKEVQPFEGFHYDDYDYSTFSANNESNREKPSFDPKNKGKQNFRHKGNFKKRNDTKSLTYNPNKKQKF